MLSLPMGNAHDNNNDDNNDDNDSRRNGNSLQASIITVVQRYTYRAIHADGNEIY